MGEKLFELFCTKNDSAKYFGECCNLFTYFVLQIIIIPRIYTFLYYRTKFPCVE